MNRGKKSFPFLEGDNRYGGHVDVTRVPAGEEETEQVVVTLTVGNTTVRLSRNRMYELVDALSDAKKHADIAYLELLKEINNVDDR